VKNQVSQKNIFRVFSQREKPLGFAICVCENPLKNLYFQECRLTHILVLCDFFLEVSDPSELSKSNIPCCELLARQVHATFASDSRM
jgi:hypothetical protein